MSITTRRTAGGGDTGDLRGAFAGSPISLPSGLGALLLGIVEPRCPGVSAAVSRLLVRAIQDARASRGGHLPDWLVDDIERSDASPEGIEAPWALAGHRFGVVWEGELIGTVHVAREHETILGGGGRRSNVAARAFPGVKPERHHHVVDLTVTPELRRARVGTAMLDGIVAHFRDRFDGDGLWVSAEPSWHDGLVGLGFVHDPSMDVFLPADLPADVERSAELPHADLDRRYACACAPPSPREPEALEARARALQERKLQYLSFTRSFDAGRARHPGVSAAPPPALGTPERDTLYAVTSDWGRVHHRRPRQVVRPTSVDEVAAILARASARGTRVTIRGRGHSAAGQSLGDELVLLTDGLSRIVSIQRDRVVVQGGATWDETVRALAPRGAYPPVLTGWLPATVGGTLAVGGYSKGSHQHGFVVDHVLSLVVVTGDGRRVSCSSTDAAWLFDAALGGFGQFGVIAEATLSLAPQPPFVEVERLSVPSVEALVERLEIAAASVDTYHVTSWAAVDPLGAPGWSVVQARGREREDPSSTVPIAAYIAPARPPHPPGPALWMHVLVARSGLALLLRAADALLSWSGGDAVQVIPVRKVRAHDSSLLRTVDVPNGELTFAVTVTREVRGRDAARLELENRRLLDVATRGGGKSYLAGTLPRDREEWRDHLGATYEDVVRAKRLADPAGVLGADLGGLFRDDGAGR